MTHLLLLTTLTCLISLSSSAQPPSIAWKECRVDTPGYTAVTSMATDNFGNTYLTGCSQKASNFNDDRFFLQKINSHGVTEWIKESPFPARDSFDVGQSVATDKWGNIIVVGVRNDSPCNICTYPIKKQYQFVAKYDPGGIVQWVNIYDGAAGKNQNPVKVLVTDNGSAIITGTETYKDANYTDHVFGYIHRINKDGKTIWIRKILNLSPADITLDKDQNVIFGGRYLKQNLYQLGEVMIAKYSYTGVSLWCKIYSEPNKNGGAKFVKTDTLNNIYVLAETDTNTFYNVPRAALLKYDTAGNLKWIQKERTHTYPRYMSSGLYIDNKSNVYIASYIDSNFRDWLISKFTSYGVRRWSYKYNDSINSTDYPTGITGDGVSTLYVAGQTSLSGRPNLWTLMAIDFSGSQKWITYFPNSNKSNSNNFVSDIAYRPNEIYMAGYGSKGVCAVKYSLNEILPKYPLRLSQTEVSNGLILSPNPAIDQVTVKFPANNEDGVLKLYNSSGMLLKQQQVMHGNTSRIIIRDLLPGLYQVQWISKEKAYTTRFLKQ